MKKNLLLPAMLLALSISSAAWSQDFTTDGGEPADGQRFEERKAEILKRIGEHLAEMQQRQSCVQAANTPAALRACMPHHGDRRAEQ